MSGWDELGQELDEWGSTGRRASFWWRDDDAVAVTPALERLLGLRQAVNLPLVLAVIPAQATAELAARLADDRAITVAQHGWAHRNHAPLGTAKAEYGPHRPVALMLGELARGQLTLDRLFPAGWVRALVPPHNRIAPSLVAVLAMAGYTGLSTYGPRRPAPGLPVVNTHADLMNWTDRAFLGEAEVLSRLRGHLAARREGRVDPAEPTGILGHHLAQDAPAWDFLDRLLRRLARHPAVDWPEPGRLFAAP